MRAAFDPMLTYRLVKPLIKAHEGWRARPYLCPANKWTIAWGTTVYPDGRAVSEHDYPAGISTDFAEVCLTAALSRITAEIDQLITWEGVELHQVAAIMDLCYNVGVGARHAQGHSFANSHLLAKLNAGDVIGASREFDDWVYARDGSGQLVKLPGLIGRRAKEKELFLTGIANAAALAA